MSSEMEQDIFAARGVPPEDLTAACGQLINAFDIDEYNARYACGATHQQGHVCQARALHLTFELLTSPLDLEFLGGNNLVMTVLPLAKTTHRQCNIATDELVWTSDDLHPRMRFSAVRTWSSFCSGVVAAASHRARHSTNSYGHDADRPCMAKWRGPVIPQTVSGHTEHNPAQSC